VVDEEGMRSGDLYWLRWVLWVLISA